MRIFCMPIEQVAFSRDYFNAARDLSNRTKNLVCAAHFISPDSPSLVPLFQSIVACCYLSYFALNYTILYYT